MGLAAAMLLTLQKMTEHTLLMTFSGSSSRNITLLLKVIKLEVSRQVRSDTT